MSPQGKKLDISYVSAMEAMECTVCVQIPRGKIYQCSNGHHICEDCSKKVTRCPVCRSGGTRQRIPFAEDILDIIKFPCVWNERGCEETMYRGQLTAHEDQCDKNPDVIEICSLMFKKGNNCGYKLTPKWLSNPGNYTEFISHISTCHGQVFKELILERGHSFCFKLDLLAAAEVVPLYEPLLLCVHFNPIFFRLPSVNVAAEQLFFLVNLIKKDALGQIHVSFAFVRLTPPEPTSTVVNFLINGKPSSAVISKWGQHSFPPLSWTQNIVCLNEFKQMVETSTEKETEVPLPFSFPASFLSEYFENENKRVKVHFSIE